MSESKIATYEQTDEEVMETAASAIAYIYEGDPLNEVYDLRGLCVFGVVGALRERDESFYGEAANLTSDQKERLAEVETAVDEAVEQGMHYYPFGDFQNKLNLTNYDHARLGLAYSSSGSGQKARTSDKSRRHYRRQYINRDIDPSTMSGPVTSSKLDSDKQIDEQK